MFNRFLQNFNAYLFMSNCVFKIKNALTLTCSTSMSTATITRHIMTLTIFTIYHCLYQIIVFAIYHKVYGPYYRIYEGVATSAILILLYLLSNKYHSKLAPAIVCLLITNVYLFENTLYHRDKSQALLQILMLQSFISGISVEGFKKFYIVGIIEIAFTIYRILRLVLSTNQGITLTTSDIIYFCIGYTILYIGNAYTTLSKEQEFIEHLNKKEDSSNGWKDVMEELSHGVVIEASNKILYWNKAIQTICKEPEKQLYGSLVKIKSTYAANNIIALDAKNVQWNTFVIKFENVEAVLHLFTYNTNSSTDKKGNLFSFITHELRSPLNIIKLYLTSIKDIHYNGMINDELENALHACSLQEVLIDDILDFSKAENNTLKMNIGYVDFHKFAKEVLGLVKLQCKYKGIKLKTCIDESFPNKLECDERRLKQVFLNLISNAIKFTSSGGQITLSAYKGKEHLMISVSDTGVGIATTDLDNLFAPFGVLESTRDINKNGTGFGLYLCKIMVEKMGGSISVNSYKGLGTTFSLLFPNNNLEIIDLPHEIPQKQIVNRPSMVTLSVKPNADHLSMVTRPKNYSRPSLRMNLIMRFILNDGLE